MKIVLGNSNVSKRTQNKCLKLEERNSEHPFTWPFDLKFILAVTKTYTFNKEEIVVFVLL